MKMNHIAALLAFALAACSHEPTGVRLTKDVPNTSAPAAKVEPVFYNGKTYQVSLSPTGDGSTALNIAGMNAGQVKDAAALGASSFHHFACKDSQKAILTPAIYDGVNWKATAHCA